MTIQQEMGSEGGRSGTRHNGYPGEQKPTWTPGGKTLKESFLEEVMPELTLERGVEVDRAE